MIQFSGYWYDGSTSTSSPAVAKVGPGGQVTVHQIPDDVTRADTQVRRIRIPSRLGHTPRFLSFPCGGIFETEDHESVDSVLALHRPNWWLRGIHLLESRLRYVIFSLIVVLALGWATVSHGVPWAAHRVAYLLPASIGETASRQTMKILDESVFSPSDLSEEERTAVLMACEAALAEHQDLNLSIAFRKGGILKANAFALPSGQIVFTDEMIRMAEHTDEIVAVLAHEIAHVRYRHGLRMLIQDSLLVFLIVFVTGDTSGTADILMGLPLVLTERAYSRDFEREADQYALEFLIAHEIPTCRFAGLLERIEAQRMEEGAVADTAGEKRHWVDYLSTHPDTVVRLEKFRSPGCN